MENPATWTPLHHEINKAYYLTPDGAVAVLEILHKYNYHITLPEVLAVINKHNEQIQPHRCGLSLPAMIVNALAREENR